MQDAIFSLQNINKSFKTVKALDSVSFDVRKGEILGLLGANGAGKSTLLKIIGGIQGADSGQILLDGNPYQPQSAFEARRSGVVSVYQELNLFCNMTAAENLFIGNEVKNKAGFIALKDTNEQAQALLQSMGLDEISPRALVGSLSVAKRQLLEIARAISLEPKILLLDEPSAALSEDQIVWMFTKVRELTAAGTTVIYVSHRLEEILELCDRCVILRDGKHAATLAKEEINRDTIVYHMVGRELTTQKTARHTFTGQALFSVEHLSLARKFQDITFSVRPGEVLGIAGLVGAGRSELLNAIYGVERLDAGQVVLNGRTLRIRNPDEAMKNGIVLVSEDRKKEGLFLSESAKLNLSANTIKRRARFGWIDRKAESRDTGDIAGKVSFDPNRLSTPTGLLSGGNQQKVVLGKALLTDASVLLLDEPTRGVDVGARDDIYQIIKEEACEGKAIILVSSDWEELTSYADRVLVMSEGRLVAELNGDDITQENMLKRCTEFKTEKKSEQTQRRAPLDSLRAAIGKNTNSVALAGMLMLLMALGPIFSAVFLSRANLYNVIWQTFVYVLLGIGQMIVIIAGGIDLSISATMTVSSVIGVKLVLMFPDQVWIGLLAMLLVGLLIGLFNGLVVVYGKIDAFVATLAVQMILQGAALLITPKPISPAPDVLKYLANKQFLGLPIVVYIGILVLVLSTLLLKRRKLGRHFFAVGESAVGASWSGLPAKKIKLAAFMLASFMGVLAGFYMLGRSGAADSTINASLALNSIAYSLIGGATLAGGKGSLSGTILAAFVISVLLNILNSLGLSAFFQDVIRGSVILVILVLSAEKRGLHARRKLKRERLHV